MDVSLVWIKGDCSSVFVDNYPPLTLLILTSLPPHPLPLNKKWRTNLNLQTTVIGTNKSSSIKMSTNQAPIRDIYLNPETAEISEQLSSQKPVGMEQEHIK